MNELETIRSRIHEIRGARVMLDFDLAKMYGVEVKRLNEQVKRNIERFPDDFMFQLTKGEWEILKSQIVMSNDLIFQNSISSLPDNQGEIVLRSQIATANNADNQVDNKLRSQIATTKQASMKRFQPYAFTELGVAMLSSCKATGRATSQDAGLALCRTDVRGLVDDGRCKK